MQEFEQFPCHRVGCFGEIHQPIDSLGKFGGTARPVAHLTGDEARIDGASANDTRQRGRQGPCPRPLRIGHVEQDKVSRATEHFGGSGKTANESDVFGTFKQIACGIVTDMEQHIGPGDAGCEGARCRAGFTFGTPVNM